jgi:hypothetical protein
MANPENLKPFTKENAAEMGRKGGLSRSTSKRQARRKWCNSTCPLWPCVFQPLSSKSYDKQCAFNKQSETIKSKYYDYIEGNESKINKLLFEQLILISDPKDIIRYGCMLHKVKFGDKNKTEISLKKDVTTEFIEAMNELDKKEKEGIK